MMIDPTNFAYGTFLQNQYINFLQQAGFKVQLNGQEHMFPFIMDSISKASMNKLNPETAKTAKSLKKSPDFIAYKESSRTTFLKGEVRCKRNISKYIKDFIYQYDEEEEFEFLREYQRGTLLIYLDVPNKNVRALNTNYPWDDPKQLDFWNNPITYLDLNQEQYDFLIEKFLWQSSLSVADRLIEYLRPAESASDSLDEEFTEIEYIF